jgi:hypothetical protein
MKFGTLPIIAIGAAAYFLLKKANAAKNFTFFFKGVTFKNFPNAEIIVGIRNPSGDSFKLDSLVGEISVNGKVIGSINSFQKIIIIANNETLMRIKVEPALVALGETFAQLFLRKKSEKFIVNLNGTANVAGFPLPINVNYALL